MVDATITQKIKDYKHDPGMEVVQLTVSNGEQYRSEKFKTLLGGIVSGNEDVDAHINVTVSGQVATINYAAQTDKLVTLILFGIK